MTSAELMSARARLGLSPERLGEELGADAERVAAWERGDRSVPGLVAQRIRWLLANDELVEALAASGLPDCTWVADFNKAELPEDPEAAVRHFESLERHTATCSTCQARERFLAERFSPLPPYPLEGRVRALAWVAGRFQALPPWLRPVVGGAALLGGIVTLRLVFALPRLFRAPDQITAALLAITAAAAAGGAGGAVYSISRPPLRKLGRLGDYLSGIAAVGGYLGALILAAPIAFGEPLLEGSSSWIVWLIATVGFGLIFGHTFFEPKRD